MRQGAVWGGPNGGVVRDGAMKKNAKGGKGISARSVGNAAAESLGIRELSKRRIREDIERAGLRLFRKFGYDAVSTQQIAAEAGITQRTLFRYFPQKAQILYRDAYNYIDVFEQSLDVAVRGGVDPATAIGRVVLDLAALHDANRAQVVQAYAVISASDDLKAVERRNQNYLDRLLAFAFDGASAYVGRKRARANPTLTARIQASLVFASLVPVYHAWLKGELKGPLVPYAEASLAKLKPLLTAGRHYADRALEAFTRIDTASRTG